MIIRRVAILSGINNKVIEKIRPILGSKQITLIYDKLGTEDILDYFYRLLQKTHDYVCTEGVVRDAKIIALLVSALADQQDIDKEHDVFYPILRRRHLPPEYRNDINRYNFISSEIIEAFKDENILQLSRSFKKPIDDLLLLPEINCNIARLKSEYIDIYNLSTSRMTGKIGKYISRVKKTKALRINGLNFKPVTNSPDHPIRRCSDNIWCDAAAKMRFGFEVPDRFEFDVTAENGLRNKFFSLCDGSRKQINTEPTHLNMRINGDFRY